MYDQNQCDVLKYAHAIVDNGLPPGVLVMGNDLLVAPMVTKGTSRKVRIPKGLWKADDGSVIEGPVEKTLEVPLTRLPYFERQ